MLLTTGVTILFFAYAACQGNEEGDRPTFKWQRNIQPDGKPFYVEEHARVLRPEVILMSSDSPALHEKQYHRSQSLHDFKNGILAIKHLDSREGSGICFLTHPAKSFGETVQDLQNRASKGKVNLEEPEHVYELKSKKPVPRTASISVNTFCGDAPMYQVEESDRPVPREYPWIIRTLCIYWPLRFLFPLDIPGGFNPTFYV